jgi:hypothetical protein
MDSKQPGIYLVLAVVGLIALLITAGYVVFEITSFYARPDAARLELLWTRDIKRLREAKALPAAFEDIKEIEVTAATEQGREWLKSLKIPVKTKPNGTHRLEILLLTWEEGTTVAAIVQYNLIDLHSKDMIWELGRTFILKGNKSPEEGFARRIHGLFESQTKPLKPHHD